MRRDVYHIPGIQLEVIHGSRCRPSQRAGHLCNWEDGSTQLTAGQANFLRPLGVLLLQPWRKIHPVSMLSQVLLIGFCKRILTHSHTFVTRLEYIPRELFQSFIVPLRTFLFWRESLQCGNCIKHQLMS